MKELVRKEVFNCIESCISSVYSNRGHCVTHTPIMMRMDYGEIFLVPRCNPRNEEKRKLELAEFLLKKYNSGEPIFLSKDEVEYFLIEKETHTIFSDILGFFRWLNVDASGVSFDNVYLQDINFRGLENVTINLDKVPSKNLAGAEFKGARFTGSFDGFKLLCTRFEDCVSEKAVDPQKTYKRNVSFCKFGGIKVCGSLNYVDAVYTDFSHALGDIIVNPQKISKKRLHGMQFNNCRLVGDKISGTDDYEEPSFEGCILSNVDFKGVKNKPVVDLDTLAYVNDVCGKPTKHKLENCSISDIIIKGNIYDDELESILESCYYGSSLLSSNERREYISFDKPETYKDKEDIQINIIKRQQPAIQTRVRAWSLFKKEDNKNGR